LVRGAGSSASLPTYLNPHFEISNESSAKQPTIHARGTLELAIPQDEFPVLAHWPPIAVPARGESHKAAAIRNVPDGQSVIIPPSRRKEV
jgi:hypothetical protein